MIEVIGLEKSYAGFPALKSISFTVPEGEVTGFLGPNGAGKTTTLRILSGFMPATQGTVKIDGFDVRERSREVRRRVGYLPEDVPLYRDLAATPEGKSLAAKIYAQARDGYHPVAQSTVDGLLK